LDPGGAPLEELKYLLQATQPTGVRLAAVQVLLRSPKDQATAILLGEWNHLNPQLHEAVGAGFMARKDRTISLINALETEKIKPEWVSRNTRNRLMQNSDQEIGEKAKGLFKN